MTAEVAIPQRYHRAIMGPKGCRIQHITREHEVQIKFPERDDGAAGEHGDASEASVEVGPPHLTEACSRQTAQEAFLHENGEVGPEEFVPRKCDIITISGRAEKCELAKAALLVGVGFPSGKRFGCGLLFALRHGVALLQVSVPITEDVGVSYELHRFIIGQKGSGIRKMMEEYEVTLFTLPPSAGQRR